MFTHRQPVRDSSYLNSHFTAEKAGKGRVRKLRERKEQEGIEGKKEGIELQRRIERYKWEERMKMRPLRF